MKALVLFFLFCLTLAAKTIQVGNIDQELETWPYAEVLVDSEHRYSMNDIQKAKAPFYPAKYANYGYTQAAVWTHLTILNDTHQTQNLIFKHPFPIMRYADVLVIKTNHTETHLLGSLRTPNESEFRHRNPLFLLNLAPNERAEIFIRHQSLSSLNINWTILKPHEFVSQNERQTLFFGLFFGIVLALVIYSLSLYLSIRQVTLLYYALFGTSYAILQASLNGIFFIVDVGVSRSMAMIFAGLLSYMTLLSMLGFVIYFFELKKRSPVLYRILLVCVGISGVFLAGNAPRLWGEGPWIPMEIQQVVIMLHYALFLYIGFHATIRRFTGGVYYLLGTGFFVLLLLMATPYLLGITHLPIPIESLVLSGSILDMVFISLAISERIALIEQERQKGEQIALEHARLLSINKTISRIIEQIKEPLLELGAISSRIMMIFHREKHHMQEDETKSARELERLVQKVDKVIMQIYDHHRIAEEQTTFDIQEAIEQSLELCEFRLREKGIGLVLNLHPAMIYGDQNAFRQSITALIEEMIDHLEQHHSISITNSTRGTKQQITIEKNSGKETPFNIILSEKILQKSFNTHIRTSKTLEKSQIILELEEKSSSAFPLEG